MKCPVPECEGYAMRSDDIWYQCSMHPAHCFHRDMIDRITIAPLPKPEPWRPRTKVDLHMSMYGMVLDSDRQTTVGCVNEVIRKRTDDIARMLEEEAERATKVEHVYYAYPALCKMARRIRSLE